MAATATIPHNTIVNHSMPKGTFLEGTINDTSKPGTIMQIDTTVTIQGNRMGWKAAAVGTDGKRALCAVLREDVMQGKTVDDAYVAGTRGFLYVPLPGETFLARVGEVAGTGNSYAVGDRLMLDAEDGILVPESGSPQDTIATCMETLTQVAGSALCCVQKM